MPTTTQDETGITRGDSSSPIPGVIVVYADDKPAFQSIALRDGELVLGRDRELPRDDRLSRRHAQVERRGDRWRIRDLGSRNGTTVNGERVEDETYGAGNHVIRIGRTLLVCREDLRPVQGRPVEIEDGVVIGPLMRDAFDAVKADAASKENLLVTGESGTGKERAAAIFHRAATPAGPYVVVNCATIPQGVAERLLFGSRRGAYSGADNAEGYVQAADRGVLMLDELGELDLDVQAKLLRVLETREVLPLGGTSVRKVDVRFCFATHRDLRTQVSLGKFRADLYHRIVHPEVALPPLRARPEDVPWLVAPELSRAERTPHVRFLESCMLRHWPGNVRELLQHTRRAIAAARVAGASVVDLEHLDPKAGMAFDLGPEETHEGDDDRGIPAGEKHAAAEHSRESLEAALAANGGKIAATARALSLHRTQLYRLLKRHGLGSKDPTE